MCVFKTDVIMCVQVSHDGYTYLIGICGKLSHPGCEQSSLCRLKPDDPADVRKYTFNKMLLEGGHMKLLYDLASSSQCGSKHFQLSCLSS